jgi:tRNA(adenine34) deaminase
LIDQNDEVFMRAAIEQAHAALKQNEVPVGAIVVKDGEIISQAFNSPITLQDPTAHAEILVLRNAGQRLNNYRLINADLYVTIEPCFMCMGALIHARIKRLIFGTYDLKAGAAGSVFDLTHHARLNHTIDVTSGVLEQECRELMQHFFRQRR